MRAGVAALVICVTACAAQPVIRDDPKAAAAEVAGRFPEAIGGKPFPVTAYTAGDPGANLDTFVEPFGVEPEDAVFATGGNPTIGEASTTVFVYRVQGAAPDALVDRMIERVWFDMPDPTHEETIGGKKVRTAGPGSYVYASADTVYFISGDPEPSLELLAALP